MAAGAHLSSLVLCLIASTASPIFNSKGFSSLVSEILQSEKKYDVIIVYDNHYESLAKDQLLATSVTNLAVVILKINGSNSTQTSLYDTLTQRSNAATVLLLLKEVELTRKILFTIHQKDLMRTDLRYLILLKSEKDLGLIRGLIAEELNLLLFIPSSNVSHSYFCLRTSGDTLRIIRELRNCRFRRNEVEYKTLNERILKVALVPSKEKAIIDIRKARTGEVILQSGIMKEFLEAMRTSLQFEYRIVGVYDEVAFVYANGSRGALAVSLMKRETDIPLALNVMSERRAQVADFPFPAFYGEVIIATRKPQPIRDVFAFIKVFSKTVWILMIVAILLTSLTIYFFEELWQWFPVRILLNPIQHTGWRPIMWHIFSSVLKQDSKVSLKNPSSKVLLLLWGMFLVIVTSVYSGKITSYIMTPTFPPSIDTVEQLEDKVSKGELLWTAVKNSYFETLFKNSSSHLHQQLWHHVMERWAEVTQFANWESLESNDIAFITAPVTKAEAEMRRMSYHLSPPIHYINGGITLRKGSPYRYRIDQIIHRIHASGLMEQWEIQQSPAMKGNPVALESTDAVKRIIKLSDLEGVFHLLFIGSVLSVITLLIEIIANKKTLKCC